MNGTGERPSWLRVKAPGGDGFRAVLATVRDSKLHTVCESARCPNQGECWSRGTATFMILGNICTRSCGFCAVETGRPTELDLDEPRRVAEAVAAMGLGYAVVTSVNRDELADGGAGIFAQTVREIRARVPGCQVELLIPDFRGDPSALATVLAAGPDVLNHNTETVPRLYAKVRPQADYARTLQLLARSAESGVPTKSGLMLGLGETKAEVLEVLGDLRRQGCCILTLGQYLSPGPDYLPIARWVPPAEFDELRVAALALGFAHCESGPLVRSSYHAEDATGGSRLGARGDQASGIRQRIETR
ncbi:MAG: lipoyl synthase [Candidatus Wallbacteria bacterium]|nr:lipoyl synthase [Candidatus Wallbacteria bacterium]